MGHKQLERRVERLEAKRASQLDMERRKQDDDLVHRVCNQFTRDELLCLRDAVSLKQDGKPLTPEHNAAIERYGELLDLESRRGAAQVRQEMIRQHCHRLIEHAPAAKA
jgi:hypothetical protein